MHRLIALLTLAVVLLAHPLSTLAAAPEINRFTNTYSFVVPAEDNPCVVDVVIEGEFTVVEHLFFDDAGTLVKVIAHINDRWTDTGPGGTIRGQGSLTVVTTEFVHGEGVETWVDTFRGMPFKLSAPGFGVLIRDAGNISVAVTQILNDPDDPEDDEFIQDVIYDRGDHPSFYTGLDGVIDEYCAILAG